MNQFLAKNKVNLEKMFLVIFLYIYMITFLAYILTDRVCQESCVTSNL